MDIKSQQRIWNDEKCYRRGSNQVPGGCRLCGWVLLSFELFWDDSDSLLGHPSVKHSHCEAAIGVMVVKKTTDRIFCHDTDSFVCLDYSPLPKLVSNNLPNCRLLLQCLRKIRKEIEVSIRSDLSLAAQGVWRRSTPENTPQTRSQPGLTNRSGIPIPIASSEPRPTFFNSGGWEHTDRTGIERS